MALYFPLPYPDEVVGSLIIRASRHLGLPKTRLSREVLRTTNHVPFLISGRLQQMAALTGMTAGALLDQHTVFPYITAYLPAPEVRLLRERVLRGSDTGLRPMAALISNAKRGRPELRFCPACAAEDVRLRHESYWRREHQLPGVMVCLAHGRGLHAAKLTGQGDLRLPHEIPGISVVLPAPMATLAAVAEVSVACQSRRRTSQKSVLCRYRELAAKAGYRRNQRELEGRQLATDLGNYFGMRYLSMVGCALDTSDRAYWPALMLRTSVEAPFTTIKHIVLTAFLERIERGKKQAVRKAPGKRTRDYGALDNVMARSFTRAVRKANREGRKTTATELLDELGFWGAYRHNRGRLPRTRLLVDQFHAARRHVRPLDR